MDAREVHKNTTNKMLFEKVIQMHFKFLHNKRLFECPFFENPQAA